MVAEKVQNAQVNSTTSFNGKTGFDQSIVPTKRPYRNPLLFDTLGDANDPLPHLTIGDQKTKIIDDYEPEDQALVKQKSSIKDEIQGVLEQYERSEKKINDFEARFFDTIAPATNAPIAIQAKQETAAPVEKEEEVSWGRKVVNNILNIWNSYFGSKTKPAETQTITADESTKSVVPLDNRHVLADPVTDIQRSHMDKLLHEMRISLQLMESALKDAEELLMKGPSDVAMLKAIQKSSNKQNSLSQHEISQRTEFQHLLLETNKKLRAEIQKIGDELNSKTDYSTKLGWVNTAATATILISGAALFFSTGGVSAAFQILGVVGGLVDGTSTIAKGIIDTQADRHKGAIDTISVNKQIIGNHMDSNGNDLLKVTSSKHHSNEEIIKALATIRDTIRYVQ